MQKNTLNEESGLPIGSDRETSYQKELDSNKVIREKSERILQKKRNSFNNLVRKQLPKEKMSTNPENDLQIQRPMDRGNLNVEDIRSNQ